MGQGASLFSAVYIGRDDGPVHLVQALQRESSQGLAIGTGRVGRDPPLLEATEVLGLTDGFAAGGPGVGDLPEEGPEGQAQIPAPVAGMGAVVFLGQEVAGDPLVQQGFPGVEGGTEGGAEAVEFLGEGSAPHAPQG